MVSHESKGLEVTARELAKMSERLGSHSEVESFRVETGHRLLVEDFPAREAAQLLDAAPDA